LQAAVIPMLKKSCGGRDQATVHSERVPDCARTGKEGRVKAKRGVKLVRAPRLWNLRLRIGDLHTRVGRRPCSPARHSSGGTASLRSSVGHRHGDCNLPLVTPSHCHLRAWTLRGGELLEKAQDKRSSERPRHGGGLTWGNADAPRPQGTRDATTTMDFGQGEGSGMMCSRRRHLTPCSAVARPGRGGCARDLLMNSGVVRAPAGKSSWLQPLSGARGERTAGPVGSLRGTSSLPAYVTNRRLRESSICPLEPLCEAVETFAFRTSREGQPLQKRLAHLIRLARQNL